MPTHAVSPPPTPLLSLHTLPYSLTLSPTLPSQVITAFINSRMELVAHLLHAKEDAIDDPLADDESLNEQLDTLPSLCRFQLQQVASYVLSLFEPSAQLYQQAPTSADLR